MIVWPDEKTSANLDIVAAVALGVTPTLLRHSKTTIHLKLRVKPGYLPVPPNCLWQQLVCITENEDHQPPVRLGRRSPFN